MPTSPRTPFAREETPRFQTPIDIRQRAEATPEQTIEQRALAASLRGNAFTRGFTATGNQIDAGQAADRAIKAEIAGDTEAQARAERQQQEFLTRAQLNSPGAQSIRDVKSVGDAGDLVAGTVGSALRSAAPAIAGGVIGKRFGPLGTAVGAIAPSYTQIQESTLLQQQQDADVMARSPEERLRASRVVGAVSAAPEALLPGLVASRALGTSRQTLGKAARDGVISEAPTEILQTEIGFQGMKALGSQQERDPLDYVDAGALGAIGGAGVSGGAVLARDAGKLALDGANAGADALLSQTGKVRDRIAARRDQPGADPIDLNETNEDLVARTDRQAREGVPLDEVLSPELTPEARLNKDIVNLDPASDEAAARMDQFDQEMAAETARRAEEMGFPAQNPTDPLEQQSVAKAYKGFKDSQRLGIQLDEISDILGGKDTRKPNLQRIGDDLIRQTSKVLFDNMSPEARSNPAIMRNLPALTRSLSAFVSRVQFADASDVYQLARLNSLDKVFADPDKVLVDLARAMDLEPEAVQDAMNFAKSIASATDDVRASGKKQTSFLDSMLDPQVKAQLTPDMRFRLAQIIDQTNLEGTGFDSVNAALSQAFGGEDRATQVLDYYRDQSETKWAEQMDTDRPDDRDRRDDDPRPLTAKMNRVARNTPFMRKIPQQEEALNQELAKNENAVKSTYLDYVKQSGLSPTIEANRLLRDFTDRLAEARKGDKASNQEALRLLREQLETETDPEQRAAIMAEAKSLQGRRTEDKSAQIKNLEDQIRTLETSAISAKRRGADPNEAMLAEFDTVLTEQQDGLATDEQVFGAGGLLKKTTGDAAKDKLIQRTAIPLKVGTEKMSISAEDVWRLGANGMAEPGVGKTRIARAFANGLTSIIARSDVTLDMSSFKDDMLIDRKTNTTFGDIKGRVSSAMEKAGESKAAGRSEDFKAAAKANQELNISKKRRLEDSAGRAIESRVEDATSIAQLTELAKNLETEFPDARARKVVKKAIDDRIEDLLTQDFGDYESIVGTEASDIATSRDGGEIQQMVDQDVIQERRRNDLRDAIEDKLNALDPELFDDLRSRIERSLPKDLSQARIFEEDTGLAVGKEKRAPKTGDTAMIIRELGMPINKLVDALTADGSELVKAMGDFRKRLQNFKNRDVSDVKAPWLKAALAEGRAVFKDGVVYLNESNTRLIAATTNAGDIYINMQALRSSPKSLLNYIEDSAQKKRMFARMGIEPEQLVKVLNTAKLQAEFLRNHELSHIQFKDSDAYPRRADGSLAVNSRAALDIEVRATRAALETVNVAPPGEPPVMAIDKVFGETTTKKSKVGDPKKGRPSMPPEKAKAIRDYVMKTRGPGVKVLLDKTFGQLGQASGTYEQTRTERVISVAIDAADPMSVAFHESLHDLFATLGGTKVERDMKATLEAAASSPAVLSQLRERLKDHPEALKQLSDPEERIAYMYQFWAADTSFNLGTGTKNIFQKIAKMIRDLMGVVSQAEKAEQLLIAFSEGDFADRSAVAQVLSSMNAETAGDKLARLSGSLGVQMKRAMTDSTTRLRDYKIKELNEIANKFSRDEGGKLGMLQRRAQQGGIYLNKFAKAIEGSSAKERNLALKNLQAMKPPSTPLEKAIAGVLDEMHTYMESAGVLRRNPSNGKWEPMRKVQNYFPRVFDPQAITTNMAEWKQLLADNGVSKKQIDVLTRALTSSDGRIELAESEKHLGFTPFAKAVQDRKLTFINKKNAEQFVKFQSRDMADIMSTYIQQAVHRAEYARDFGNDGEVIQEALDKVTKNNELTPNEVDDIKKTISGLEGTLGHDIDPLLKSAMSSVITLQNVILLPMAIFSQAVDPMGLAIRTGEFKEAGKAYVRALKDLKNFVTRNKDPDAAEDMAKMLGIIDENNMIEAMGQVYGSMYMTRGARDINKMFFRLNGMQGWNSSMRIAATQAGLRYLAKHKNDTEKMAELGLKSSDVKVDKDGNVDTSSEAIQGALFNFVDSAITRPNASHRPTWMSDPRFMLIGHLKQFAFSFHKIILGRVGREIDKGNMLPAGILATYIPIMIASDMAKWTLTGSVPENWTAYEYFMHGVQRAGILGKFDLGTGITEDADRGRTPGTSLLGPTAEHASLLINYLTGGPATTEQVIDRSVPLARLVS